MEQSIFINRINFKYDFIPCFDNYRHEILILPHFCFMQIYKKTCVVVLMLVLSGCDIKNENSIHQIDEVDSEGKTNIHIFKAIQQDYYITNNRFATSFNQLDYPAWKGDKKIKTSGYDYILLSKNVSDWTTMIAKSNDKSKLSYVSTVLKKNSRKRSQLEFSNFNCISLSNKNNNINLKELLDFAESSISRQQCPPGFTLEIKPEI